jgi:CubicO group peptidase (beta-lactamase class C family)
MPLAFQPGSKFFYSLSCDVLGVVISRISGQSFEEFMTKSIFEPLGMLDTHFTVPAEKMHRCTVRVNYTRRRLAQTFTHSDLTLDTRIAHACAVLSDAVLIHFTKAHR